jgi:glycosyltransferase involved in cell wall biosynthesis
MPVAFVMPCLNEASLLETTAASLGFGDTPASAASDVYLVLVDNGSTDRTLDVMERIASASRVGAVSIVEEAERGFVPPRRKGTLFVRELALRLDEPVDEWLILQADADTHYLPGYAQWMQRFLGRQKDVLLEGAIKRDAAFDEAYPSFRALEREVDATFAEAPVADEEEIIVDDKVCGYRLSDYLRWGGHFQEFDVHGTEVHAETSRLFLRARLEHGVTKVRVNPAQAIPSRRRIIEDPALHFATAGFPREASWLGRWRERHLHRRTIAEFSSRCDAKEMKEACFYRRAHQIALFWLLPWLVKRAKSGASFEPPDERTAALLRLVPEFGVGELVASPALAFSSVLCAIEHEPDAFC